MGHEGEDGGLRSTFSVPLPAGNDPDEIAGPVPHSPWFLIGLTLVLLVAALLLILPFLGAIVLAVLIGFLMQPVHRGLLRVVRSPSLAAFLGLVSVAVALVLPIVFVVRALTDEAASVVAYVQEPTGLQASLDDIAARFGLEPAQTDGYLQQALAGLAGLVQGALVPTLTRFVNVIAGFVLFFFLLFFVLRDGAAFGDTIRRLTPLRDAAKEHLFALVAARARSIAMGTFLVSIAQGVAAGIGWWYFGFPAPVFWAFVMTVIAVLPLGAPMFVIAPAGIIAIAQGNYFAGVGILLYGVVVVGLIDNLLRPYVVARGSDAHPAVILVGTIGGLAVFGVSGFLLGPLLLSLLGPVLEVWAEERRAAPIAP